MYLMAIHKTALFNLVQPKLEYEARYRSPQALKAGGSLIIPVDFTGVPTPKVQWFYNDQPLSKSPKVNIDVADSHSTLTIKNVNKDSAGVYKVVVENKAGQDEATFEARVTGMDRYN